jgi:hypothetical protein
MSTEDEERRRKTAAAAKSSFQMASQQEAMPAEDEAPAKEDCFSKRAKSSF